MCAVLCSAVIALAKRHKPDHLLDVAMTALRVGYAAARDIKYANNDQLVYATTGHWTAKLLSMIKRCNDQGRYE